MGPIGQSVLLNLGALGSVRDPVSKIKMERLAKWLCVLRYLLPSLESGVARIHSPMPSSASPPLTHEQTAKVSSGEVEDGNVRLNCRDL